MAIFFVTFVVLGILAWIFGSYVWHTALVGGIIGSIIVAVKVARTPAEEHASERRKIAFNNALKSTSELRVSSSFLGMQRYLGGRIPTIDWMGEFQPGWTWGGNGVAIDQRNGKLAILEQVLEDRNVESEDEKFDAKIEFNVNVFDFNEVVSVSLWEDRLCIAAVDRNVFLNEVSYTGTTSGGLVDDSGPGREDVVSSLRISIGVSKAEGEVAANDVTFLATDVGRNEAVFKKIFEHVEVHFRALVAVIERSNAVCVLIDQVDAIQSDMSLALPRVDATTLEAELLGLQQLLDGGFLSEDEFEQQRARILG